mgnify:CR=1 FL=1
MKKYMPLLVVACFFVLYLGPIWQRPLYIPDETRYAEIPREMIASGDFIVPRLNGLLYFEKPVLGYWMNAAAMMVFGEVPGAVRIMGALCTLLSALLIWLLCRRAGEEKAGRVAAMVFLLSGLVFAVGTYGVLDAHLSLFVMLAMTAFYYAYTEKNLWKQAGYLVVAGVGVGLAFLVKGLLGFVLPAAAIVPFLLWQREWKRLFTLPWIPLIAALAVLAPWAIAVHRAEPDFWHQFIGVEHVQRFTSGQGANDDRSQPFWYFLPVLLGGLMPWTLFVPAVWLGYRGKARELFRTPLLRYSVCMAAVWFVLFSVSSGKLATYILPCFPACAILIAAGLVRYAETGKTFREADWVIKSLFRVLLPALIVLFALQAFNLFAPGRIPQKFLLYWRGENFFLPVIAIMVLLLWLRMAQEVKSAGLKFICFGVGIGFAAFAYPVTIPAHLVRHIAPVDFIVRSAAKAAEPGILVMADDRMTVATSWALRSEEIGVYRKKGELAYGLDRPEGRGRFYPPERLKELVEEGARPILVVTGSDKRVREMPSVPGRSVYSSGGVYLVHYRPRGEKMQ